MIWIVRIVVVGALTAYGPVSGRSPILGFLTGLVAIALSLLVGKLGKVISRKVPNGAKYAGIGFYWLGVVLGVWFAAMAVYAAYESAPIAITGLVAVLAVLYWAAGWGLRRSLRSN